MLFCSGVHLRTRLVETGSGMELELGAVLCILPARELVVTISTVGFAVALVMDTHGASSKEMVSGRGNHSHPVCHGFEASSEMAEEQRGGHSVAQQILEELNEHSHHVQRVDSCSQHAPPREGSQRRSPALRRSLRPGKAPGASSAAQARHH